MSEESTGGIRVTVTYGAGNSVTVECEAEGGEYPTVNELVSIAREELQIPEGVSVTQNGMAVPDANAVRVAADDHIAAIQPAGRKG
jgi:hypothetical protein